MENNHVPYVISADLHGLIQQWADNNQLTIPNNFYFNDMLDRLIQQLGTYFYNIKFVPEELIREGLLAEIDHSYLPTVSLDRAYIQAGQSDKIIGMYEATRAVDENFHDLGIFPRPGTPNLNEQVCNLVYSLNQHGSNEVQLVDDVIFHGGSIIGLINSFAEHGIIVRRVAAGIAIEDGIQAINERDPNIEVVALETYPEVIDEVCQRDYVAGAPFSGRVIYEDNNTFSTAPYLLPFGNPSRWASIPEANVREYSEFCLQEAMVLWTKIENLSDTHIRNGELPRKLVGVPEHVRVVTALEGALEQIRHDNLDY